MHSPMKSSGAALDQRDGGTATGAQQVRLGLPARLGLLALTLCALAALFWPRGDGTFKEPGGFLFDNSGQAAAIGTHLAPVTLVHFWATWCPPCIKEIPALQRLSSDFSRHHDFKVLMVAVSDSNDKVRSFLGSGAEQVLFDPEWEVAKRYGTDKLPETYLVIRRQGGPEVRGDDGLGRSEGRDRLPPVSSRRRREIECESASRGRGTRAAPVEVH